MRSGSNSSSPRWVTASEFKRPTPSIQIYTRLGDAKIDGDVKGVTPSDDRGPGDLQEGWFGRVVCPSIHYT